MNKKPSIFSGLVFGLLFAVVGYATYKYITNPMEEEAKASELWPSVSGEIIISEIESYTNHGERLYSADIHYSYMVEGEEYNGAGITNADASTSVQSSVKKDLKRYPKGKIVDVYYDPDFPEISVLEPGINFWNGLLFKIPFVFMFLGAIMFLMALKNLFRRILFGR